VLKLFPLSYEYGISANSFRNEDEKRGRDEKIDE
jgi:hypothetical protein